MEKYRSFQVEDYIVDDFFIRWVLNGSEEDGKIWENWLLENPAEAVKVEQAKNIVSSIKFNKVPEVSQAEIDSFIQRVKAEHLADLDDLTTKTVSIAAWNKKWLSIAAAILIAGICTFLFVRTQRSSNQTSFTQLAFQETTNNGASPVFIYMADGSSVILKPKSTLKYPKAFTAATREVYLSGEAFFEVHKNPKQPFLVHTGIMTTRVLGTSFTVKAFNGDKDYSVVVNTGKVLVYTNKSSTEAVAKQVTLVPNQQVVYHTASPELVKQNLPKPTILSEQVTQKAFDFKGTPFNEVIDKLKGAYQVNIIYDGKAFAKCRLTAALYDDHLYDKLTIICKAVDASFAIVNGQIVITGKGCNP
jgi:transmembrane sensor